MQRNALTFQREYTVTAGNRIYRDDVELSIGGYINVLINVLIASAIDDAPAMHSQGAAGYRI